MLRTLIMAFCLRRLRRVAPEMFDGNLARLAVEACIAQDDVDG